MHLWHIPGVAPIGGRPNSHMVRILNVSTPRGNIMSRCQQYIASVHISCQISYHHDYRQPRHNVVERLDTYWFMICCQKCLIWHHHMLMICSHIWYILDAYLLIISRQRPLIWGHHHMLMTCLHIYETY